MRKMQSRQGRGQQETFGLVLVLAMLLAGGCATAGAPTAPPGAKDTEEALHATLVVLLTSHAPRATIPPTPTDTPETEPTPLPDATPTSVGTLFPLPSSPTPTRTLAPSATATQVPTPTPVTYVVQRGDTLGEIAKKFGVSVEALARANDIDDADVIDVGWVLVVPVGG